ncbi:MAG: hypothetical protein IPO91_34250 [Chloroflexi bacterium]|nr:hypothetical protein [Chloroflexota bacterium]
MDRAISDADYASIGEWRDPNTTKPTQAECDAEWAIYQQEEAAAAKSRHRRQPLTRARSRRGKPRSTRGRTTITSDLALLPNGGTAATDHRAAADGGG